MEDKIFNHCTRCKEELGNLMHAILPNTMHKDREQLQKIQAIISRLENNFTKIQKIVYKNPVLLEVEA